MASFIFADVSPAYRSLQQAYSPIITTAQVLTFSGPVCPVVYCDVYFNHFFYKTISATTPTLVSGLFSFFQFDISGLAQEYIKSKVPNIGYPGPGGATIENIYQLPAYGAVPPTQAMGCTRAYVKFRVSSVDVYGVVTPDAPQPVQGNMDSYPAEGTGYATDNFQIVNAATQWSYDKADLETHLQDYRRVGAFGITSASVYSSYAVYQLSHIRRGRSYTNDYGQIAVLIKRTGFLGSEAVNGTLLLEMYNAAGLQIYTQKLNIGMLVSETIYCVPYGLKNLSEMMPGMTAHIKDCYTYQVALGDVTYTATTNRYMYVTPRIYVQQAGNTNPAEHTRIWFRNYMGQLDALNFRVRDETLKVTSTPTERVQLTGGSGTNRQQAGMNRNNVRSNESNEVSEIFLEEDMVVIKELMSSAQAYIEVKNPDYTGTPAYGSKILLPIVITDAEYESHKYDDRYEYQVSLKYTLSNENKIVRQ